MFAIIPYLWKYYPATGCRRVFGHADTKSGRLLASIRFEWWWNVSTITRQRTEWVPGNELKHARLLRSDRGRLKRAGKDMVSIFWSCHNVLFVNYLKKGKIIKSESGKIIERTKSMRNGLVWIEKVLFCKDNASSHIDLGLHLLSDPPYSADLAR